ncbi:hypothetical protein E3U43_014461%2C partial [Xyrichtys novacula]|uniref:Uncharacterized protein n=1 Tax=Xyrichtys novacula TaxID=13765 RepID=A0AAV1HB63_XYRNO|nr:hypothetical protein E3U43_014461%2C partial [Xyrichtys novacula]
MLAEGPAASAPLPPSAPPLPLLDPLSPAGICLLLLLRELFLELGGREISTSQLAVDPRQGIGGEREGGAGDFRRGRQECRGEATPWFIGERRREEEKRISLCQRRAKQDHRRQQGNQMSPLDEDLQITGAALPGCDPEEPLMEPCLTLQLGVFNQCNCPSFSICACFCLPLEPEGGLLMAAAVMAMVVMVMVVVMMMMRWQWRCSRGFWLSSLCLLKDSLR